MTSRRYIPRFREFSGGLNLRDAQSELALDDLAAAYNISLDDRGGANSRLGRSRLYTLAGNTIMTLFYSKVASLGLISQSGTKLYTGTTLFKTFTTEARCGLADFAGKLCIVHPVDGMFTYDGTTLAAVAAGPKADSLAAWQNKLWANDKSGTHPSRINFSAAGDPTTWAGTNDIRDVDDDQIVCVFSGHGQDIKGLPGLLAFKAGSTYRINDSTTAAYTTVDAFVGAASGLAVTALLGRVMVLSGAGVFVTDGVAGLSKISGKLDPLFTDGYLGTAAGATQRRAYFSVTPEKPANLTPLMLEYDPDSGSFTLNSNYASCYAFTLAAAGGLGPVLASGSSIDGRVYNELSGGTDDGTAINAYLQTSFIELHWGLRARLNSARVNARGTFTLSPLYDYDLTQTITRAINVPTGSATVHGGYQDVYNLGQSKTIAFRAEATTSVATTIPFATPGATTRALGGWGLYGIDPYPFPAPIGRT